MAKVWFKRKSYGWGWVPVTWEGWLTVAVYLVFIMLFFWQVSPNDAVAERNLPIIIPVTTIATAMLIAVSFRFGESPRWQWGGKPLKKPPFKGWLKKFTR
jgi:uncharacterized membrane protein YbhN (UPF0104 family)